MCAQVDVLAEHLPFQFTQPLKYKIWLIPSKVALNSKFYFGIISEDILLFIREIFQKMCEIIVPQVFT